MGDALTQSIDVLAGRETGEREAARIAGESAAAIRGREDDKLWLQSCLEPGGNSLREYDRCRIWKMFAREVIVENDPIRVSVHFKGGPELRAAMAGHMAMACRKAAASMAYSQMMGRGREALR